MWYTDIPKTNSLKCSAGQKVFGKLNLCFIFIILHQLNCFLISSHLIWQMIVCHKYCQSCPHWDLSLCRLSRANLLRTNKEEPPLVCLFHCLLTKKFLFLNCTIIKMQCNTKKIISADTKPKQKQLNLSLVHSDKNSWIRKFVLRKKCIFEEEEKRKRKKGLNLGRPFAVTFFSSWWLSSLQNTISDGYSTVVL